MNDIKLWSHALLVTIATQLVPIVPLMLTVGLLIAVDTAFGIWAAIKKGQRITSNGLSRLITKMLVYQTSVVTFFFIETHIMGEILPLTKFVAGAIVFVESVSVLENAGLIVGKPVFRIVIDKLSSKSNKFGEK